MVRLAGAAFAAGAGRTTIVSVDGGGDGWLSCAAADGVAGTSGSPNSDNRCSTILVLSAVGCAAGARVNQIATAPTSTIAIAIPATIACRGNSEDVGIVVTMSRS